MLACVLTTSASVRFTVWANAMLSGGTDPDTAARRILGDDVGHHVAGLPDHPAPVTLPVALNLLRTAGGRQAHLALPVPGDPIGLAGPPPFNEVALEAGEAVIVRGTDLGLVPAYVGPAVQWTAHLAAPPAHADLGEADRPRRTHGRHRPALPGDRGGGARRRRRRDQRHRRGRPAAHCPAARHRRAARAGRSMRTTRRRLRALR